MTPNKLSVQKNVSILYVGQMLLFKDHSNTNYIEPLSYDRQTIIDATESESKVQGCFRTNVIQICTISVRE